MVAINTNNILFICGGAFEGIERKIAQRLNTKLVGYSASKEIDRVEKDELMKYVAPQDLRAFGLIPEIIGRLPILASLESLGHGALRKILTEPVNSVVKQYVKLMRMDGISLEFDDEVFDYIVEKALEYKLGARGLRSICELILMEDMFHAPSRKEKHLQITLELAKGKLESANINRLKAA